MHKVSLAIIFVLGLMGAYARAEACDLMRLLQPGETIQSLKQAYGAMPWNERERCGGRDVILSVFALCRTPPATIEDAHIVLHFSSDRLTGWSLMRRGPGLKLLGYAEKHLGRNTAHPPLDTGRVWANLHWQGKTWLASYMGQQAAPHEIMEQLDYWEPRRLSQKTTAACEKE